MKKISSYSVYTKRNTLLKNSYATAEASLYLANLTELYSKDLKYGYTHVRYIFMSNAYFHDDGFRSILTGMLLGSSGLCITSKGCDAVEFNALWS